jgi:hypothetical protein
MRFSSCFRQGQIAIAALWLAVFFCPTTHRIRAAGAETARAVSIKGLQVQMVDDALALGIKHAALNVSLTSLIDLDGKPDSLSYRMDGHDYHFHRRAIESIAVKPLSDAGVKIYLILLATTTSEPRLNHIMRPAEAKEAPNGITGFNVFDPEGVRYFQACLGILAERFSRPDQRFGRAVGYIIGNEVNSHAEWYNIGPAPMAKVAREYLRAIRLAHSAVRRHSPDACVYVSLEHHWTAQGNRDPLRACPGRALLDEMNRHSKAEGDFDWHVAFHPYPANLFDPRTWRDKEARPTADTPKITFKNLEQLTAYLRRPEMLCLGKPRRVILSEEGFHTPDGPDGQTLQAAGYCYGWVKASRLDGIDAFILNRHVDHAQEGGLRLGLWTRRKDSIATPESKKKIYEVFRLADTPEWEDAFRFALPVIGIHSWDEVAAPKR